MTGKELMAIRKGLGLSRCGMAIALGLGDENTPLQKRRRNGAKSIRRYETGIIRITDRVAGKVRALVEGVE